VGRVVKECKNKADTSWEWSRTMNYTTPPECIGIKRSKPRRLRRIRIVVLSSMIVMTMGLGYRSFYLIIKNRLRRDRRILLVLIYRC